MKKINSHKKSSYCEDKKGLQSLRVQFKKGYATFFLKKKIEHFSNLHNFFPLWKRQWTKKKIFTKFDSKVKNKKAFEIWPFNFQESKILWKSLPSTCTFFIVYSNFRPNCVSNRNNKFILSLRVFHNGVEYVIILIKISHLWTRL